MRNWRREGSHARPEGLERRVRRGCERRPGQGSGAVVKERPARVASVSTSNLSASARRPCSRNARSACAAVSSPGSPRQRRRRKRNPDWTRVAAALKPDRARAPWSASSREGRRRSPRHCRSSSRRRRTDASRRSRIASFLVAASDSVEDVHCSENSTRRLDGRPHVAWSIPSRSGVPVRRVGRRKPPVHDREAERLPVDGRAATARAASATVAGPQTRRRAPEASIVALPRIEPGAWRPIPERQGGDCGRLHLGSPSCAGRGTAVGPLDGTQLAIESCVEALQLHGRMVPPAARSQFVPRSSPD